MKINNYVCTIYCKKSMYVFFVDLYSVPYYAISDKEHVKLQVLADQKTGFVMTISVCILTLKFLYTLEKAADLISHNYYVNFSSINRESEH